MLFYGKTLRAWLNSESDAPTWTCLLFQKTAEEDQFEDVVKQVKESLKSRTKLVKGSTHAFSQIGRGIGEWVIILKDIQCLI